MPQIFTRDLVFGHRSPYLWKNQSDGSLVCQVQDAYYGGRWPVRYTGDLQNKLVTQSVYEEDLPGYVIFATRETQLADFGKPTQRFVNQQTYEGFGRAKYLPAVLNSGDAGSWETRAGWSWTQTEGDVSTAPRIGTYRYRVDWHFLFNRLVVGEWWSQWLTAETEPDAPAFNRYEVFEVGSGFIGFRDELAGTVVCIDQYVKK